MGIQLERMDEYRWRIPRESFAGMNVDGIVYSSSKLIDAVSNDASLEQVRNVAMLPGIVGASFAMPDIHWGYGFPIGGVAAFDIDDGVISPGGVGYDINCGISLVRTNLDVEEITSQADKLADALYAGVPCGVGVKGDIRLTENELKKVVTQGARWAVRQGLANDSDIERMEDGGCLEAADTQTPGQRAFERGRDQLGTLGSGNHFVEVQRVEEIYDERAANTLGLVRGRATIMIHSGSRGFGYQVCQDQLKKLGKTPSKYGLPAPDRQLACAPIKSPEGHEYASAMSAAANYAWANRILLVHRVRSVFESVFGKGFDALGMGLVLDIAHNIAKFETHIIKGQKRELCVHRKGATRAFGPNDPRIPTPYKALGQPLLIPGDMGTASYVLTGTQHAAANTFGSACHGAGRLLSRTQALRASKNRNLTEELFKSGIVVRARSMKTLGEETSEAYKNINHVVDAAVGAGLAKRVAKLSPLVVVKG